MKDELGFQIMKKIVELHPKTYIYLKDKNDEGEQAKGTRKCVVKRTLKFADHKKILKGFSKYKYSKLFKKERNECWQS